MTTHQNSGETRNPRLEVLFAEQLARTPDQPAVMDDVAQLTYADVDRESRAISAQLAATGVAPGDLVGISTERSLRLPIAVLGTLRAGAAYVPLDTGYPAERLSFMVEDAGLRFILTDGHDRLKWLPGAISLLPLRASAEDIRTSATHELSALSADATAYVIFTSGSTGRPKGVAMPHRRLVNLVRWHAEQPALGKASRTLQFTPLSFDVSFQEIFTTWATGGCLVTVGEEVRRDPFALVEHLAQHGVERIFLPFVALEGLCQAICRERPQGLALRDVITAGEQLRITPAIRAAFGDCLDARLHNHYGPSETHLVTAHTLTGDPSTWPVLPPIGRVVGGARLFILDSEGLTVSDGDSGELFVGGNALADGYVNQPDLTAERFREIRGLGQVYRTGDMVRRDAQGMVEFLGRQDDQVKIRGFRVELGEVEAAIGDLSGINQTVVIAERTDSGPAQLVAYVVLDPGIMELDVGTLRRSLKARLPEYMIPARFVAASSLPLTPSGKVDRAQLAQVTAVRAVIDEDPEEQRAEVDTRAEVLRIHRELLRMAEISLSDNFFDLGGDSLFAVQVITRIRDAYGVNVPVKAAFEATSIADFADHVDLVRRQSGNASQPAGPVPAGQRQTPRSSRASMAQEWALLSSLRDTSAPPLQFHVAFRLQGPVDVERLRKSLQLVFDHHPSLRTWFKAGNAIVEQHVNDGSLLDLRMVDFGGEPAESREARVLEFLDAEAGRRFDRSTAPLVRVALVRCAEQDHFLAIVLDHLIADGWSVDVITRDISVAYSALARGEQPTLKPAGSYLSWAQEQRKRADEGRIDQVADYWLGQLGYDPAAFALRLPGYQDNDGLAGPSSVILEVPAHTLGRLDRATQELRSTPYCLAMAALKVLLAHETGKNRITVSTSAANRTEVGHEDTVGWCSNGIFPTSDIDLKAGFRSIVRIVQETILAATAHADMPAWYVRRRMWPSMPSGFRKDPGVYFMYHERWGRTLDLSGITITPVPLQDTADFPGLQFVDAAGRSRTRTNSAALSVRVPARIHGGVRTTILDCAQ